MLLANASLCNRRHEEQPECHDHRPLGHLGALPPGACFLVSRLDGKGLRHICGHNCLLSPVFCLSKRVWQPSHNAPTLRARVLLCSCAPANPLHVLQQDPKLQEATASEPLTLQASLSPCPDFSTTSSVKSALQEEYDMQLSWCEDADSKFAGYPACYTRRACVWHQSCSTFVGSRVYFHSA